MKKVIVVLFFLILVVVLTLEVVTFINMLELEQALPNVDYLRRVI